MTEAEYKSHLTSCTKSHHTSGPEAGICQLAIERKRAHDREHGRARRREYNRHYFSTAAGMLAQVRHNARRRHEA